MKTFLICFALALLFCGYSDAQSWRPNDHRAASGECQAVRKQQGRTQWRCADGTEFWLDAHRHKEKQGDWRPPKDCKPAQPPNSPNPLGPQYTANDAKNFRQCSDGQSFWAEGAK